MIKIMIKPTDEHESSTWYDCPDAQSLADAIGHMLTESAQFIRVSIIDPDQPKDTGIWHIPQGDQDG